MNVQECDGMHLKKLLKLLEQGPKAFNMVKCHPLTSNKNSINFLCQHLFRHRHDLPPNSGKMGRVCHHLIPAYGRGKGLSVCSLPFGATCSRWRLKTGRAEPAKAGRRVCRAGERFIQDLSRRGFRWGQVEVQVEEVTFGEQCVLTQIARWVRRECWLSPVFIWITSLNPGEEQPVV